MPRFHKIVGLKMGKVVCPRCGMSGYLERQYRGDRAYLYVVHGRGKNRTRCYIGPAESYEHAELLHLLGLTNIMDVDYAFVAESAVRRFIQEVRLRRFSESKKALIDRVEALVRALQHLIEELGELEEDLLRDLEAEEREKD
jgi:hypothetical protein